MSENMYTYVVIDDEMIIRKGLISRINAIEEECFQCIGEASNGVQGLELINQKHPDIVITDMRMSQMNGVELLEELRKMYPELPIIVISGYKDFDYVKKAIEKRAVGYVLKPFSIEEIRDQLNEAVQRIQEKKDLKKLKQEVRYIENEKLTQAFMEITMNAWNDEFNNRIELEKIPINKKYLVFFFFLSDLKAKSRVIDTISTGMTEQFFCVQIASRPMEYAVYVEADPDKTSKNKLRTEQIIRLVKSIPDIKKTFVAFMDSPLSVSELHEMECRARNEIRALQFGMDYKSWKIGEVDVRESFKRIFTDEKQESFFLSLKYADKDLNLIIKKFFYELSYATNNIGRIGEECRRLLVRVNDYAIEKHVGVSDIMDNFYTRYIFCDDLTKMQNEIGGYIRLIFYSIQRRTLDSENTFDKIEEYVQKNYFKKLTVQKIASDFDISSSECSRYFYENKKMGFNDYLGNIRIEKAKVLLEQTTLTAEKISDEVGYANPKYFFRIFKKNVGKTPVEYREQQLNNE